MFIFVHVGRRVHQSLVQMGEMPDILSVESFMAMNLEDDSERAEVCEPRHIGWHDLN